MKNWLVPGMLAVEANGKIALIREVFVKVICATPTVYLFQQIFFFFYVITAASIGHHFKMLVLFI